MNETSPQIAELSSTERQWRVKLYHLSLQGQWVDVATGYIFIDNKVLFMLT